MKELNFKKLLQTSFPQKLIKEMHPNSQDDFNDKKILIVLLNALPKNNQSESSSRLIDPFNSADHFNLMGKIVLSQLSS